MIRFLRQNAEICTSICVVLALLIGGSFLYQSQQAQKAGQAELDAIMTPEKSKEVANAQASASSKPEASAADRAKAPAAAEEPTP